MNRGNWRPDEPAGPGVPIGQAARSYLRARGLTATVRLADVMAVWDEAVGHVIAAQARPVAMRSSALVVEVAEPAWVIELQFHSVAILGRLAERLGEAGPAEITVRVRRPGGGPRGSEQGADQQSR
ncbi:MAG: DUF721 domain-containing protein [Acidimicrobiales bacterium]